MGCGKDSYQIITWHQIEVEKKNKSKNYLFDILLKPGRTTVAPLIQPALECERQRPPGPAALCTLSLDLGR